MIGKQTSGNQEKNQSRTKVMISGLGAVTPYGEGVERLWQGVVNAESAISEMDRFDLGGMACTQAGVIRDRDGRRDGDALPRASYFAFVAGREALQQAGILFESQSALETALITATNFADIGSGESALTPSDNLAFDARTACFCAQGTSCDRLAERLGLGGLRLPLSLSCASGAAAAAFAADLIVSGHVQRVLVIGFDELSRFAWSGLCALRTMTREAVRPFDLNRNGTIFTEGAAALVFESEAACRERHAIPLVHFAGWATGNNGHHMTAPSPRGAGSAWVIREALACAGLSPQAVDHLNLHGTGTKPNDVTESEAVHDVFGERAAQIPVTSVKGALGHMLGAAGTAELIISVLSLRKGVIPPTDHLDTPDPACALDVVTVAREASLTCVVSNSAGIGGCNAAAVLTLVETHADPVKRVNAASSVVITGMGIVSALGVDAEECAAAWREQEPAFFPLTRIFYDNEDEDLLVGEAPDPDLTACGVSQKAYLDPATRLFLAACGQALKQTALSAEQIAAYHVGVLAGTAWGCQTTEEVFFADYVQKGPRLVKPFLFPHTYANTSVSLAAIEWSLKGAHANFVAREIASGIAVVTALDLLRENRAKVLVVGGGETLSTPRLMMQPSGQPLGEASAVLVFELAAVAAERQATILGTVLGYALAQTPQQAVQEALEQAGRQPVVVFVNRAAYSAAEQVLRGVALIMPEQFCGNVDGATTVLHLALALLSDYAGPVMILTQGKETCVALVVAPRTR